MFKKIGLIIFGILLIILFELSLCLAGKIFLLPRALNFHLNNRKFEKLICCVGDSHTFGVGTIHKYSYPKQLEALLNLNNPEILFHVINLGIPGNSTKSQINRLATFLDKNRTDLVILLTGRNNYFEVKVWKNKSLPTNIIVRIQKTRIYKIMRYVLTRIFKIRNVENINAPIEMTKYEDYMEYQLNRAKSLCEKHGCRLLLLSYHNSHDKYIEKLAKQSGILYFNLHLDFFEAVPQKDIYKFISRDRSHMNLYGYKIFAELLYKQMFLHKETLNLRIDPLSKKIDEDIFHEKGVTNYLIYAQGKSIFY